MDEAPQVNRSKIRLGLAMVALVVLLAMALFFVIDDTLGRAVMFGVALAGFIQIFLLTRSLRRGDA